ncbi:hypothetical protein [Companilactobacillus sp. HBUAS59699]|uniref:hypothetical protein n=1 Tax=Companilactobacillus sp. HBUAS59699 TaxID=3109358 RepID=UPI002FF17627
MNKKGLTALVSVLMGSGILLTGCSIGNVSISDNSTKTESPKKTNKETKADKLREKEAAKKEKAEESKRAKEQRGKEYTYGIPHGPAWIHVYANGKKTTAHMDPTKINTVKLHENDTVKFGGPLPLVGNLFTREMNVSGNSSRAKMDDEGKFDKMLSLQSVTFYDDKNGSMIFYSLKHLDNKGVSDRVFADLPKYLDAASTNDPSKLPNQSDALVKSLDGTNNLRGDSAATYQVIEQYFNKKSALHKNNDNDFHADDATYVQIHNNSETNEVGLTQLYVQVFAKVKKTDTDQHEFRTDGGPKYGSTSTEMEDYSMEYQLTDDNNWELVNVFKGETSPYSMNTSGSNWIMQKN